jgi:rare lipoprotein A
MPRLSIRATQSLVRLWAALAVAAAPLCAQSHAAPARSGVGTETGIATVYAMNMQGQATASGAPYDPSRMSAAHRSLSLGTRVKVLNLATQQSVEVVINDRWGGGEGRIINLSDGLYRARDCRKYPTHRKRTSAASANRNDRYVFVGARQAL